MKRLFWFSMIMLSVALAPRKGFGQWVQTNGPYGGWVFCITHFGNDIFIGTIGGVFESTDQGSNWQRKSNGLPGNLYVYTLTTRGSNIFAGTYEHGVYRSTDSGATWISASSGLPNSFTVRILGSSANAIFAPDEIYSYMSTNDGDEWELVDTNLTKVSVPESIFSMDSIAYLVGGWITETTDDGLHWAVTAVPPAGNFWDIYSMANIGEILFAVDRSSGVLRSTDHGETWDNVAASSIAPGILFLTTIGTYLFAGASDGSVYITRDSGATWQLSSLGAPVGAGMSFLASYGAELFAGLYGPGIFRSQDSGKTWLECNQGLINIGVNAIASTGDTTIVGTNGGVFLSTDNGYSWQSKNNGLTDYNIASLLIDSGNLYVGGQSISLSTDRGESWSFPDSGLNESGIDAMIQCGPNLIAGGDPNNATYGFYKSINGGLSWSACSVTSGYRNIVIYGLLKVGSTLLAVTNGGPYISHDDGNSWESSDYLTAGTNALGFAGSRFFLSRIGPYDGDTGAVFVSEDNGITWYRTTDTSVPPRGSVTCFASVGNALFVPTDSDGIFLTTDYGASWIRENSGLGDSSVLSIAVQGGELLAGTASSGVWRRTLAEMIPPSSVASENQPAETISVYPDPASSLVTVSCPDLEGAIDARLISITGVTVWRRTLNMDGKPFQLDFTGVANGVYCLDLNAGDVQHEVNIVLKR